MSTGAREGAASGTPFLVPPVSSTVESRSHTWTTPVRTHVAVQELISEAVIEFATVPPDEIDEALQCRLRQIGETLHVDQVLLWTQSAIEAPSHVWIRHPHPVGQQLQAPTAIPLMASRLASGEAVWFARPEELANPVDRAAFRRYGIRSAAIVPMATSAGVMPDCGCIVVSSTTREHDWAPATIEQLRLAAGVFGLALTRKSSHQALHRALDQLDRLRSIHPKLDDDERPSVKEGHSTGLIESASPAVRLALTQAERVAPTPATVLLLGETGVGKQVFAQAIHSLSPRGKRPMVHVNCGAIPATLIESELFGRERGAYTGAIARQVGRFEAANLSTIFLDEIAELPAEVQVKLLAVLQDRVIERLGSSQSIKVDVRVIAATNRNLERAVGDASFREDLFYRLNVFPITVPPLRERTEDIPGLVWTFVDEFSKSFGKPIDSIANESMLELRTYSWPGNVRELRNVIERAVILATDRRLIVSIPRKDAALPAQSATTLATLAADHIRTTLERTKWRIRGRGGAAEILGLKPTTLESRMARLGMVRPVRLRQGFGGTAATSGRRNPEPVNL